MSTHRYRSDLFDYKSTHTYKTDQLYKAFYFPKAGGAFWWLISYAEFGSPSSSLKP